MRIWARLPAWFTRWGGRCEVINNGPIGELNEHQRDWIEDDALEHIGLGIVVERP